ncbi:hypothetical protein COD90_29115 [Bacillus cereus]|nr:hypothetical protein COD90_29115 [Bacillus cereus]RFB09120.1 hypothetical protein DZB88_28100 [Bacillus sp. OE]SCV23292.1 Protein of unknown function [Bacillus cereus]
MTRSKAKILTNPQKDPEKNPQKKLPTNSLKNLPQTNQQIRKSNIRFLTLKGQSFAFSHNASTM